jgi:hypothetical protein
MDFETRSLNLLFDAHAELSASLNSLGGKQGSGYVDNFKFWSSVYMGHVSQGFICLRRANGTAESRFLIRPAIELMLKQKAIEQRPDLIYRLGLTETRSDRVIDGGEAYYKSHYRTYCKFTHATLRVIIGGLDEITTDEDNPTMILCVLCAVESLASIGGSCPNLARLSARRDELLKQRLAGC